MLLSTRPYGGSGAVPALLTQSSYTVRLLPSAGSGAVRTFCDGMGPELSDATVFKGLVDVCQNYLKAVQGRARPLPDGQLPPRRGFRTGKYALGTTWQQFMKSDDGKAAIRAYCDEHGLDDSALSLQRRNQIAQDLFEQLSDEEQEEFEPGRGNAAPRRQARSSSDPGTSMAARRPEMPISRPLGSVPMAPSLGTPSLPGSAAHAWPLQHGGQPHAGMHVLPNGSASPSVVVQGSGPTEHQTNGIPPQGSVLQPGYVERAVLSGGACAMVEPRYAPPQHVSPCSGLFPPRPQPRTATPATVVAGLPRVAVPTGNASSMAPQQQQPHLQATHRLPFRAVHQPASAVRAGAPRSSSTSLQRSLG